ncbi:MAG: 3-dehydroquinate synthase [Phycisphaeraceae bacterium]|nr:MAG: 3-dehydroquinate synthase [Phycisphaeraceae bacterium]
MIAHRITLHSSADRSYDVAIGADLLSTLGPRLEALFAARPPRRVFVAHDDQLPFGLVETATESLRQAGFEVASETIRASEENKTLETLQRLLIALAESRHERTEPVVALGGGVTGDVAGFAAASYRRGVPVVQCPTTLLSMVDASVGGKTGVNLPTASGLKKNLVGSFWQPALVLIDIHALRSLPDRHFRAGLAECIKHGLIARSVGVETDLLDWTGANMAAIVARDESILPELIRRNVAVKAHVVNGDEREEAPSAAGGRALLNLGHTFAHAIETIPGLSPDGDASHAPLLHGEAVALGLVAAAAASARLGELDPSHIDAVRAILTQAGLPIAISDLPDAERIIEAMSHDKKVASGRLRLVLPVSQGEARVIEDPAREAVEAGVDAIRC